MNYREKSIARQFLIFGFIAGVGFVVALIIMAILRSNSNDEPTLVEMQNEFAAYSMCMQSTNCQMTPEDFIDYYDLKYRIVQSEGKKNTNPNDHPPVINRMDARNE